MSQGTAGGKLNFSIGEYQLSTPKKTFCLETGERLNSAVLAYETYGKLNREKDNAILILGVSMRLDCVSL